MFTTYACVLWGAGISRKVLNIREIGGKRKDDGYAVVNIIWIV